MVCPHSPLNDLSQFTLGKFLYFVFLSQQKKFYLNVVFELKSQVSKIIIHSCEHVLTIIIKKQLPFSTIQFFFEYE